MFKLLTRKDLWVLVAFSAVIWFGLPMAGPSATFSKAFASLILLLSLLAIALAETEQTNKDLAKPTYEENTQENQLSPTSAVHAEAQKEICAIISELREDIRAIKIGSASPNQEESASETPQKLGELSGALSEAMKQISSRDGQIDLLAKNVNQSNIQRNLVRLTQTLEFSLSLHKRIVAGQSDPAESMQFIVDDLESALAANGVEHMVILAGTKIPELKAGSFIPVTVVEAPSPELKGTVKEVRTRAYFINEDNRPRFISPAKVVLYKA